MAQQGMDPRQGILSSANAEALANAPEDTGARVVGNNPLSQMLRSDHPAHSLEEDSGQLPGSTVQAKQSETSSLLSAKFEVKPTIPRALAGLADLFWVVIMLLPFAFVKLVRFLLEMMGVNEHRWRGRPDDEPLEMRDMETLMDVVDVLRSSSVPQHVLDEAVEAVSSGNKSSVSTILLAYLRAVINAQKHVIKSTALPFESLDEAKWNNKFADVLEDVANRPAANPEDVLKKLKRVAKASIEDGCACLYPSLPRSKRSESAVQLFTFRCLLELSLVAPAHVERKIMSCEGGGDLVETVTLIPLDIGAQYLRSLPSGLFEEQVSFMSQFSRLRPSNAKKEVEVQAMAINARVHKLLHRLPDGTTTEIAACPRSGAFAVHGRKPNGVGLSMLMAAALEIEAQDSSRAVRSVLKQIGLSSTALMGEIELRSGCCVAQALPVILSAIKQMCRSKESMGAAYKCGSFLYTQQSLLSDLQDKESSYLQDHKGALDILSQSLQISFHYKPDRLLEVPDGGSGSIKLTLDRDLVPESAVPEGVSREDLMGRTYGISGVMFSVGVNVLQGLGFLNPRSWRETIQDALNRDGLERINEYAMRTGKECTPGLLSLNAHFAPHGAKRHPKDVESINLVRRATLELGGIRCVNCKSGKDRTAMELALAFSQHASEAGFLQSDKQRKQFEASFRGGLSYKPITSDAHGKPACYAFNEIELVCLPHGWAPMSMWKLCGTSMS